MKFGHLRKPSGICEDSVRKVLNGKVNYLISSFSWDNTPQGSPYWDLRNSGRIKLSGEDIAYLKWIIDERPTLKELMEETK